MQGQLTDNELQAMYQKKGDFLDRRENKVAVNHVVIKSGNHTYNYYTQHEDGSWTNYDCKTKY